MANGIINIVSTSIYIKARIVWSTSGQTLTATLQLAATNGHTGTSGTWNWAIGIGTSQQSGAQYASVKNESVRWTDIGSFSATVYGSSVSINAVCYYPSETSQAGYRCEGGATVQVADPVTPDPDPGGGASAITTASNGELGGYSNVTWTPKSSSYWYKLYYLSSGGYISESVRVQPGTTGPYTARIQLNFGALPSGNASNPFLLTLRLSTHTAYEPMDSTTQVGEESTFSIYVTIPENDATRPVVSAVGLLPDPAVLNIGNMYVQGKTGVKATSMYFHSPIGSQIAARYFRVEGKNYNYNPSSPTASDAIAQSGQITVSAYVTDFFGFTSKPLETVLQVIPYHKPKLKPIAGRNRVTAQRCNSDGTASSTGSWIKIMARREYSPVVYQGVQRNWCSIQYRYKPDTGSAWSAWTQILAPTAAGDEITTEPLIGTLNPQSTYQVEIQAVDTIGETGSTQITVLSDTPFDHANGALGSYGFGKFAEEEHVFDIASTKTLIIRGGIVIAGDAYLTLLDLMHPVGSILETVVSDDPAESLGGSWTLTETTESAYKWRRTE